ncbi:DUF4879 domain-containing protein [Chromobacterium violaceum]|uniref:DUF4879 domain-containing protein n=1 Tax=Chromobacterium violaceum TaxID=536 RepID=A0AAX2M4B4_CHRVL|nr:DUF4879 domain-containing protein [Chromobacterium violaceum]OLZ82152.1 hypothetical protein BS642_07915 [Chromobacterium violaceum]STB71736.1 Uncharacterised protein [Chromobacterium violaceum]SUX31279.1 Uncharacterised protein [Chromobacterium violaceum]
MRKISISVIFAAICCAAASAAQADAGYSAPVFSEVSPQVLKALPRIPPVAKKGDQASLLAPAEPLRSMRVVAVESDRGGVETFDTNGMPPYETQKQHAGGSKLLVSTFEIGHGRAYAKYNGANLGYVEKALCQDYAGSWHLCTNGELVAGWLKTWNAAGRGAGQFESWSTSLNMPYNTYQANIKVK